MTMFTDQELGYIQEICLIVDPTTKLSPNTQAILKKIQDYAKSQIEDRQAATAKSLASAKLKTRLKKKVKKKTVKKTTRKVGNKVSKKKRKSMRVGKK